MRPETFFDELDLLINSRERSIPDTDIDIESFQLVDTIRKKTKRLSMFTTIAALVAFAVVCLVLLLFLFQPVQKMAGFVKQAELDISKKKQIEQQEQLSQLDSENTGLKKTIDDLKSQIEIAARQANSGSEDSGSGDVGPDGVIRHLVSKGETLYSLAKKYYGTGSQYELLASDNRLESPEALAEGMTLKIYPEKKQQ